MNKKHLEVVQGAVRNARDAIVLLFGNGWSATSVDDADLYKMACDLNRMGITLSKKIDGLEVVACPTTDTTPASSSASAPEN